MYVDLQDTVGPLRFKLIVFDVDSFTYSCCFFVGFFPIELLNWRMVNKEMTELKNTRYIFKYSNYF